MCRQGKTHVVKHVDSQALANTPQLGHIVSTFLHISIEDYLTAMHLLNEKTNWTTF